MAIYAFRLDKADDLVKILSAVLTPLIGLAGAATGFYFGSERSSGR